jgi:hypothetical protein
MRPTPSRSDTNAWQSLRIYFLALVSFVVFPGNVKQQAHGSKSDTFYRYQGVVNVQHIHSIFVNNQLDAQFLFSCMFISILYMFRAAMYPSSGELIISIRCLVYVTLYRRPFDVQVWVRLIQTCTPNGHLYTVTYSRCPIDTINSPYDGHNAARNT